ncbi:hypothetical protein ACN267_25495 [Micromonospora sp. WMMD734]|uniref:hypothetical protein n=1 Tax=Micromonospora sp. WMMD734 TaxID=3404129 RepID=UPI003B9674F8
MAKSRRLVRVLLAASAAAAISVNGVPAHAGGATVASASEVSVALGSLMELYPGSVVVSEDTLRIAPGVEITMPASQPRNKRVLSKAAVKAALDAPARQRPAPSAPSESWIKTPAQRGATAEPPHYGCNYQYLCLFADQGFLGYSISFYTCGFRDLATFNYPTGGKWNDRITGYVNNQTSGTVSTFSNWNGSSFVKLFSSEAIDWNSNIGLGGLSYNDIIDGVRVC